MEILFFGQLAELTGVNTIALEEIKDTNSLLAELKLRYPGLENGSIAIAVDKKIVQDNTPLQAHNSVALLPPFSGG